MTDEAGQFVKRLAVQEGFDLVGIAPAQATEHEGYIHRWLAEGRHGEMGYLGDHLEERLDPRKFLAGARSIVCVAAFHEAEAMGAGEAESASGCEASGRVARYAWGGDYHRVFKARLGRVVDAMRARWPEHAYRAAVDTSPVLEREHAQRAGLGWVGKHTVLIHPRRGSWFLLGEIVTTVPLPVDAPETDHCGTCTRCIEACPTRCISPYGLDASRCVGYLTVEHRGLIDPGFHEAVGDWLAGCDVCQEVCPYNDPRRADQPPPPEAPEPPESPESPESEGSMALSPDRAAARKDTAFPLLEVLGWDAAGRQAAVRGSALRRIRLEMFKRNALIAAGNRLAKGADARLLQRIRELAVDATEEDLVRATARQVLRRLDGVRPPSGATGSTD